MCIYILYCVHTDILFGMAGPHVFAPSQVFVPVVLRSELASNPAAAAPASVWCLTQRDSILRVNKTTRLEFYIIHLCTGMNLKYCNRCTFFEHVRLHVHAGFVCKRACVSSLYFMWPMVCVGVPAEQTTETLYHL